MTKTTSDQPMRADAERIAAALWRGIPHDGKPIELGGDCILQRTMLANELGYRLRGGGTGPQDHRTEAAAVDDLANRLRLADWT